MGYGCEIQRSCNKDKLGNAIKNQAQTYYHGQEKQEKPLLRRNIIITTEQGTVKVFLKSKE